MLGEESRIVGISSFTVRPHRAREEKPKVCAFLSAKIVKILALQAKAVFGFPIGQPIPQPYPRAKAAPLLTHPA